MALGLPSLIETHRPGGGPWIDCFGRTRRDGPSMAY